MEHIHYFAQKISVSYNVISFFSDKKIILI